MPEESINFAELYDQYQFYYTTCIVNNFSDLLKAVTVDIVCFALNPLIRFLTNSAYVAQTCKMQPLRCIAQLSAGIFLIF